LSPLKNKEYTMSQVLLRDVRKTYGKNEVVHGVNLAIEQGEFTVILGPSGCGKSTLLRMVAGLESITSGIIEIGGKVVNKLEPRERGCAMVFQNYALYPHMSVAENIGYSLRVAGIAAAERRKKVEGVAQSLGLSEFLDRKPAQLSGGQRQRVAIGRAIIREPKVFLYDEPLSNLDARLRVAMRIEIRKLHQRLGTTSLFVTHDQVEAMTLADRIVVMNKGVVEQVGTPAQVYGLPESIYVASFIGTPGLNLIEGIANPQSGSVTFADGQSLSYDRERWPHVIAGPIIAGFRAEQMHVGQGNLVGTFEFAEELGAAQLLHCSLAGTVVIAQASGHNTAISNDSLSFAVDANNVHLFDKLTGRRLAGERTRIPNLERVSSEATLEMA
jgi:sn-glycerol 3-phosphate transport system ATP-binding protein